MTTAERLREMAAKAKPHNGFRDTPRAQAFWRLGSALADCAEKLADAIHAHGPVEMCDGPDVCPMCAFDRALAAQLESQS